LKFHRIAKIEITNINKFISDLRVFLNSERLIRLIGETEIYVSLPKKGVVGNILKAEISGRKRGVIGEISFQKLEFRELGTSEGISRGPQLNVKEKIVSKIGDDLFRLNEITELSPSIFMVDVYVDQSLPEEFKHLVKSFLRSYTDVGSIWNHII